MKEITWLGSKIERDLWVKMNVILCVKRVRKNHREMLQLGGRRFGRNISKLRMEILDFQNRRRTLGEKNSGIEEGDLGEIFQNIEESWAEMCQERERRYKKNGSGLGISICKFGKNFQDDGRIFGKNICIRIKKKI